jgi:hypothetical protein
MVFEMFFVRQAYTQVLAHELRKIVRMVRAFPTQRFDEREPGCGESARELAVGFIHHVRRIDEIAYGGWPRSQRHGVPSRGEILLELETSFLGAHTALATLPPPRWADVIPAPQGLSKLAQARRGELLWLALRELIRHDRHFALHMRNVIHGDGAGTCREASSPDAALGELAVGV